jgi:hypothetical protein
MISREDALRIADARAEARDWGLGPQPTIVEITSGWPRRIRKYEVKTNAALRGTRARFVIDAESGEILEEGYIPR